MMTYYIENNQQIVLYDTDRKRLADTLLFMPQYKGLEILETENPIVDGKIISHEEYEVLQLEQARKTKLEELNTLFNSQEETAHMLCSLGFEINAGDRANRDIEGLIKRLKAGEVQEPVMFCDYNNQVQPVTLQNLEAMQLEIIANGQLLYQKKWFVREKINALQTVEELEALNVQEEFAQALEADEEVGNKEDENA